MSETPEALFDSDGYPADESLEAIRTWDISSAKALDELMAFCGRLWFYPDRWAYATGDDDGEEWYAVSTGGWSGNESVIDALEDNVMAWMLVWLEIRRGGHYKFLKRPVKEEPTQ